MRFLLEELKRAVHKSTVKRVPERKIEYEAKNTSGSRALLLSRLVRCVITGLEVLWRGLAAAKEPKQLFTKNIGLC